MSETDFKWQDYRMKSVKRNLGGVIRLNRSSLSIGWDVWVGLNKPTNLKIQYDVASGAIKLVPDANGLKVGEGRARAGEVEGHALTLFATRLAGEMPLGAYTPISHNTFIHESKQR